MSDLIIRNEWRQVLGVLAMVSVEVVDDLGWQIGLRLRVRWCRELTCDGNGTSRNGVQEI